MNSTDHFGMFAVILRCVLVLLELLDWPCVAGAIIFDELRPLPLLESSIATPSSHP